MRLTRNPWCKPATSWRPKLSGGKPVFADISVENIGKKVVAGRDLVLRMFKWPKPWKDQND